MMGTMTQGLSLPSWQPSFASSVRRMAYLITTPFSVLESSRLVVFEFVIELLAFLGPFAF